MQEEGLLKEITRRLDILISLQLEALGGPDAARPAAKIRRLSKLGLSASEVASIMGKPTNYVTATLSQHKGGKRMKGRTHD